MQAAGTFIYTDLIPESWHRSQCLRRHLAALGALATVLLGGVLLLGLYYSQQAASVSRRLARVSDLTQELSNLRIRNDALDGQIESVRTALAGLESCSRGPAWGRLLAWLAAAAPESVLLTAVSTAQTNPGAPRAAVGQSPAQAGDGEPTRAPTPTGVMNIEGVAVDQKALNRFLESLKAGRTFASVTLLSAGRRTVEGREGLGFTLACAW